MAFDYDIFQFSPAQVIECSPGLNIEAFRQWQKREQVLLAGGQGIGPGQRPKYSGSDVIQVGLRHGIPSDLIPKFIIIWHVVQGRIIARQTGLIAAQPGPLAVLFYLHPQSGELMSQNFVEAQGANFSAAGQDVPDFHFLLRVDNFIERMTKRRERILAGERAIPKLKPDDAKNWTGEWSVDDDGEQILIGLTRTETEEIATLSPLIAAKTASAEQFDRFHKLDV